MNNKTNKLIPDLRFPEFVEEGEWSNLTLVEISKITSGGTPNRSNSEFWNGDIPWISTTLIDFNTITQSNEYITENGLQNSSAKIFPKNTILMAMYGQGKTRGKVAILGIEAATNQACAAIILKAGYNTDYVFQYLAAHYDDIRELSNRGGQENLSGGLIESIPISIPKLKEQSKIAACLSSLDEIIAAHSRKLEALKEHKKGLMQNLFPQEGEMVPKWRFSEFAKEGEWAKRKLESYINLFSGIALKSEDISDNKSGIPILRGINITEGYIRHSQDIDKYFLGDLENLNKYLVKENDIVIGMDGSKVGKNVALVRKEDANSILIQRVARIRTNEKSDIKYIYQHFMSNKFRGYVDTVNTSSGIPHISAQQIKDFTIGFPPRLKEQQKIAECLSSLDELIAAQAEKIEQFKLHKKGLMQGLFPQIDD